MEKDREHSLYYLSVEDTTIATFVWLDDELEALAQQGLRLPRQKGGCLSIISTPQSCCGRHRYLQTQS
jgi:hypothetical protein